MRKLAISKLPPTGEACQAPLALPPPQELSQEALDAIVDLLPIKFPISGSLAYTLTVKAPMKDQYGPKITAELIKAGIIKREGRSKFYCLTQLGLAMAKMVYGV